MQTATTFILCTLLFRTYFKTGCYNCIDYLKPNCTDKQLHRLSTTIINRYKSSCIESLIFRICTILPTGYFEFKWERNERAKLVNEDCETSVASELLFCMLRLYTVNNTQVNNKKKMLTVIVCGIQQSIQLQQLADRQEIRNNNV